MPEKEQLFVEYLQKNILFFFFLVYNKHIQMGAFFMLCSMFYVTLC